MVQWLGSGPEARCGGRGCPEAAVVRPAAGAHCLLFSANCTRGVAHQHTVVPSSKRDDETYALGRSVPSVHSPRFPGSSPGSDRYKTPESSPSKVLDALSAESICWEQIYLLEVNQSARPPVVAAFRGRHGFAIL